MAGNQNGSSVVEALRSVPLFRAFSDQDEVLAALADNIKKKKVGSGIWLLKEGELGQKMFILTKGQVEVTKTTLENEQYTVASLGSEDQPFFGELALLDEDRRSASIRTTSSCEVLELDRRDFESFGNRHPSAGLAIMRELAKIVCRRFRATNGDVVRLFSALVNEISQQEVS